MPKIEKSTIQQSKTKIDSNLDAISEEQKELTSFLLKYMTPKDLEKELGLSISQQYKLRSAKYREYNAKRGGINLPFIKQMGLIMYDRDDVVKWLDSSKKN